MFMKVRRFASLALQIFCFILLALGVSLYGSYYKSERQAKLQEQPSFEDTTIDLNRAKAKVEFKKLQSKAASKFKLTAKLNLDNQSRLWKAFTLLPVSGPEVIQLINTKGKVVHEWNNIDADRARLLPNGNLLVLHGSKNLIREEPWVNLRTRVSEYDWEGNMVWSYNSDYVLHHDVQRLANGNTLLLQKVPVPKEYLARIKDPVRRTIELKADRITEIDSSGKVVWQWDSWEHIDLNECGVRECPGKHTVDDKDGEFDIDDFQDWTHLNTISVLPENKWYEQGDKRFKPGNIIIMPRNFWTIYLVDHETGEIVWQYQGDYKGGLVGGHEPSMIPEPYPGAGNIIILDNGSQNKRESSSFILEINPQTKKTEWIYDVGQKFFTRARGSVQRLPNGNTLISEDRSGRVFEVTPEKEIVWEYQANLLIVRAHKYSPEYCDQFASLEL